MKAYERNFISDMLAFAEQFPSSAEVRYFQHSLEALLDIAAYEDSQGSSVPVER